MLPTDNPKPPTPRTGLQDPNTFLGAGWFPINTVHLKKVQAKLEAGTYEVDRELLIHDLKSDFSLFAYCMKSMGSSVRREDREREPLDLIRTMEIGNLRKLLAAPEAYLIPQSLDKSTNPQIARIKHLLVSCSAAEAMCLKRDINPDTAFTCALARQLGLTLVAFNYPRIYGQAVAGLKSEKDDLEKILKKVLGFSATQVGLKLALGWNRNTQLQKGLGSNSFLIEDDDPLMAYKLKDEDHKSGEELRKICEIGELLAKLSLGEPSIVTTRAWDAIKAQVKGYLGADAIQIINDRVSSYQARYLDAAPHLFKTEVNEHKLISSLLPRPEELLSENTYVRSCHGNLRQEFEGVYRELIPGDVSPLAINALVGKVVPLAGFVKGCIFLADPKKLRLIPTVRIGKADISEFKVLNYADAGLRSNPIIDALHSAAPIRQEDAFVNGEVISIIAGMFGNEIKSGILYLQMSKELTAADRNLSILYFKAIRECLNHCLNL